MWLVILLEKNVEICDGWFSFENLKNDNCYIFWLVFMFRVVMLFKCMVKLLELELDVLRMLD